MRRARANVITVGREIWKNFQQTERLYNVGAENTFVHSRGPTVQSIRHPIHAHNHGGRTNTDTDTDTYTQSEFRTLLIAAIVCEFADKSMTHKTTTSRWGLMTKRRRAPYARRMCALSACVCVCSSRVSLGCAFVIPHSDDITLFDRLIIANRQASLQVYLKLLSPQGAFTAHIRRANKIPNAKPNDEPRKTISCKSFN